MGWAEERCSSPRSLHRPPAEATGKHLSTCQKAESESSSWLEGTRAGWKCSQSPCRWLLRVRVPPVNCWHQEHVAMSQHCTCPLIRTNVFVDFVTELKELAMRSSWMIWAAPTSSGKGTATSERQPQPVQAWRHQRWEQR